jgi:acetylornithine deacetylase/succinyl-diaminopimelate desuccinylase-like protein
VERRIAALLARPDVAAARAWIESHDTATVERQCRLAGIPAPTFAETQRGDFVAAEMRHIGLADVRSDDIGNVIGRYGEGDAPGVMLVSHLDTVFPAGTDLTLTAHGPRLSAPGIGDNARGLAALLAIAEACVVCDVQTTTPITFVASVGEEALGDLRGVKHLLSAVSRQPSAFVALDGPGLDRIVHRALGTRRLRATYTGPGGHSWAAFGVPNPAHAVAIAAAQIAEIPLPATPRTALSVVRIGGGQSVNTIPTDAWLELDLRSESDAALAAAYEGATGALQRALDGVNRKRATGTAPLTLATVSLSDRPSGVTPEGHPLVQAALAATHALGGSPALATASTDANVPISLGIPAVALGAGGKGGDAHLESEWYDNTGGPAGIVRALLVVLGAGFV